MNRIIKKLLFSKFVKLNKIKTILFNFYYFDFKIACKLPIYIYNDVQLFGLGQVIIDSPNIYRGMIRIGGQPMKSHGKTKIWAKKIIFKGRVDIWAGNIIEVYDDGALTFGNNVTLGEGCKIMCKKSIIFHDNIRVGYDTSFMDTDFHYILNIEDFSVKKNTEKIEIGEGTWISSNCRIMKGTNLPPQSVVVGGSLLNKDYSKEEPNQVFVGTPAKPVKKGIRRIFNTEIEDCLNCYFNDNPSQNIYHFDKIDDLDAFCTSSFFRN